MRKQADKDHVGEINVSFFHLVPSLARTWHVQRIALGGDLGVGAADCLFGRYSCFLACTFTGQSLKASQLRYVLSRHAPDRLRFIAFHAVQLCRSRAYILSTVEHT